MCDSNPTRICASVAKKNLKAASDSWNALKDSNNQDAIEKSKLQLYKAMEDFDETKGGQQILASQIKLASSDEEKEKFQIRKDVARKRRQQKNKEAVALSGKTCYKCKIKKTPDDFDNHANRPDGLQNVCKSCRVDNNKKYYQDTPEKNPERMAYRTRRDALIQEITLPIMKKGCVDCHEYHEGAMEFDHIPERGIKVIEIGQVSSGSNSDSDMIALLKEELKKCEVRCSNCHQKITYLRQANNKRRTFLTEPNKVPQKQRDTYQYLIDNGCVDCGTKDLDVLEFDHIDGSKKANVSFMAQQNFPQSEIDVEIAKCKVRCSNCHTKKTKDRASKKETTSQSPKYVPTLEEITCSCGKRKSFHTKVCRECHSKPRIEWPAKEIVLEMLKDGSFTSVSKMLGVSDNSIRNFLKSFDIDPRKIETKTRKPK